MAIVRPANFAAILSILAVSLSACGAPRQSFTAEQQASAVVPGMPDIRAWADSPEAARSATRIAQAPFKHFSYLALSGGGGDGAFGAGLLKGWTRTGTRPEFSVVSGVSTGALIAPFAFLGPAYDDTLKDMYTGGYGITLIDSPDPISAVFGPGIFDSGRMLTLARKFVTSEVIAAVAREHRKGRRLLVLTTNIDAQRPVVWDMGAIAASGAPGADELFRTVMAASASIPGIFTPTLIPAESGGHRFQEMHVDGGVISNVFVLPDYFLANSSFLPLKGKGDLYVLMNGKLHPTFEVTENRTVDIVGRSVSTMIRTHSRATLQSTYALTRRSGIGFHLAAIPGNVHDSDAGEFDTDEMRQLYQFGYDRASSGKAWVSAPSQEAEPQMASTRVPTVN